MLGAFRTHFTLLLPLRGTGYQLNERSPAGRAEKTMHSRSNVGACTCCKGVGRGRAREKRQDFVDRDDITNVKADEIITQGFGAIQNKGERGEIISAVPRPRVRYCSFEGSLSAVQELSDG